MAAKTTHQHEDYQLAEVERGWYCRACGEFARYRWPEHEKLKLVAEKSQAIGAFVDWMSGRGLYLSEYNEDEDRPRLQTWSGRIQSLLAEYFDIDERVLEQEKRAMLARMQETVATEQAPEKEQQRE